MVNIVLLNVVAVVIFDGERQSAVARFSWQHRGLVISKEMLLSVAVGAFLMVRV